MIVEPDEDDKDYSLVGASGMGGIVAGGAFDFQLRYILCRFVTWISDPDFYQLLHEGTGDVDVRFRKENGERREHIQVKDHIVTPTEFREVIETFLGFDRAAPGVYQRFVLAAPDLSPNVKPLKNYLKRLRAAADFYDTAPKVLDDVRDKIRKKLQSLGLDAHFDFILEKLDFDIELHNCHDDDRTRQVFWGTIREGQAEVWKKLRDAGDRVYDRLFREVSKHRQQVLSRSQVENILDQLSIEIVISVCEPPRAVIGVHNWAFEKLDPQPDYAIDWSEQFDRSQKRVPQPTEWNGKLVPELYEIKKDLLAEKGSGLVRIIGSGCLSTQVALGLVFRAIEGWTIETVQQPGSQIWRSDASPTANYPIQIREIVGDSGANAIALLLSIKNDVYKDVESYLDSIGSLPRAFVNILPPDGGGLHLHKIERGRHCVGAWRTRRLTNSPRASWSQGNIVVYEWPPIARALLWSTNHVHGPRPTL